MPSKGIIRRKLIFEEKTSGQCYFGFWLIAMKFAERRPILPWRVTNIFVVLDVRSLTVASRSRQSRKVAAYSGIGALIKHAHMPRSFRASRTVATCHG